MRTIKENMDAFQKQMWSHPKPLEFCVEVVAELLTEVQRQRTVMRAGLEEIDEHWNQHILKLSDEEVSKLVELMDNLGHRQSTIYPQYLTKESYEEYLKRIRIDTDFARLAEGEENGEE